MATVDSSNISYASIPDFVEQDWLPLTNSQGITLAFYRVRASNPKALLFYFHGYASGFIVANRWSYDMSQAGFEVLGLDYVGHGRSGVVRGEFSSIDQLVDDAVDYIRKAKEIYGSLPVILSGQSMGGLITVYVSKKVTVEGMLLFAPALGLKVAYDSNCLNLLAYFAPSVKFILQAAPPGSTNLKAMMECLASGLLGLSDTTAGGFKALTLGCDRVTAEMHSVPTPFVVIVGGSDGLIEEKKCKRLYTLGA
jgi:esterase/lipase